MEITFWKNNKIDQEFQMDLNTIIIDFIKSEYQSEKYSYWPFERQFLAFITNYGTFLPFTDKHWIKIWDTYKFYKNLETYKDFI